MAIKVAYTGPKNRHYVTETLETWRETTSVLQGMRQVLYAAYKRELAENLKLVDPAILTRHYSPFNWSSYYGFADSMREIMERGSRITVLRGPVDGKEKLIGFSRLGPAPNLTRSATNPKGYEYEGYYLNNVAVRPDTDRTKWGQGIGSMLLHANFTAQNCDRTQPLVLDGINGNDRVNAWYMRLGMVPQPDVPTDVIEFGNPSVPVSYASIPETYYVTPPDVMLGGVMDALETRHPWLKTAEIVT